MRITLEKSGVSLSIEIDDERFLAAVLDFLEEVFGDESDDNGNGNHKKEFHKRLNSLAGALEKIGQ